jgi:hypothetical protein
MFSHPMYFEKSPTVETGSLLTGRVFKRLLVRPEPSLDNAIAAKPIVHAARNRLDFRELRHL